MHPVQIDNPVSLSSAAVIDLPDWNTWGGSMVRTPDGECHLVFSRWPYELGFDAWATSSQFGYATAPSPAGPFEVHGTLLGPDDAGGWDSGGFHNPSMIAAEGRYYLYYTGQHGNGEWWNHRNNQRVGVAMADHPSGPWRRSPEPLIAPRPGHIMTATPHVFRRLDGRYQIVYKTVTEGPMPFGGSVHHVIAVGDSPTGPFEDVPEPFIRSPRTHFPIDDHVEWAQDGTYFALVKDRTGDFTGEQAAMILFTSEDGIRWEIDADPIVVKPYIERADGTVQRCDRLEMPKLHFEDGRATRLVLSVLPRGADRSFTIVVPVRGAHG